ncbi:MAG: hypothetical protein QOE59_4863 [Actinomycetota bacterium]|jgi:hypothetical protein|nr:hypothetical protein [Actinomycetota bacterium]
MARRDLRMIAQRFTMDDAGAGPAAVDQGYYQQAGRR